jgi:hypothetical protein
MTDYAVVLKRIRPGAQWSLNGDTFDGLTWLDESPAPTQEELDAAWPQVAWDAEYAAVQAARRAAYVEQADPLFFRWQRNQATEQDWLDAVAAVDAAHPYPDPL